jgi:hypothetical protein
MYLCYMDESGDTGVSLASPTPTYTVAAVLVHETHWVQLFEDMIAFRRYLRSSFGLRMRAEIKATQLIRGSGPWSELGLGQELRKRIFRSLMRFQARVVVCSVMRWSSIRASLAALTRCATGPGVTRSSGLSGR